MLLVSCMLFDNDVEGILFTISNLYAAQVHVSTLSDNMAYTNEAVTAH